MSTIGKDEQSIIEANNLVVMDLYSRLAKADKNLFISPFSILAALYMAYAGARQNTAAQMERALHITIPQDESHHAFSRLSSLFDVSEGYELAIANALSMKYKRQILDSYKDLIKSVYRGEFLEFSSDIINGWVSKQTHGHIKKILDPDSLESAVMVLANAIYFKGLWQGQFEKKETRDSDFFLLSGETVRVPMMNQAATFRYDEDPTMQILEMDYKGYERSGRTEKVSMVVFLPKERNGLNRLEESITSEFLQRSINGLRMREVEVIFPRFRLETGYKLSRAIKDMGMTEAFTPNANYSGITAEPEGLWFEEIIHRAMIEVDEEGTVATAATVMEISGASISLVSPPVFRADHPFLFLLRDVNTGIILFIGKFVGPIDSIEKRNPSVPLIKKLIGRLWRS